MTGERRKRRCDEIGLFRENGQNMEMVNLRLTGRVGVGAGTGAGTGAPLTTEKLDTETVLPAAFVAVTFNVCDPNVYGHGKKSVPLLPFMAYGAPVSILVYVTGEPSSNLTDAALATTASIAICVPLPKMVMVSPLVS
jgi:hypothetical protein